METVAYQHAHVQPDVLFFNYEAHGTPAPQTLAKWKNPRLSCCNSTISSLGAIQHLWFDCKFISAILCSHTRKFTCWRCQTNAL